MALKSLGIVWLRRDLRIYDHAPLHRALTECKHVVCMFLFDRTILNALTVRCDRRVVFLHRSIALLKETLQHTYQSNLHVVYGDPVEAVCAAVGIFQAAVVYAGKDYEPDAVERDEEVARALTNLRVPLILVKDHVIKEPGEIVKPDGTNYMKYTAFQVQWRARVAETDFQAFECEDLLKEKALPYPASAAPSVGEGGDGEVNASIERWKKASTTIPSLASMGFDDEGLTWPENLEMGEAGARRALARFVTHKIDAYDLQRDLPYGNHTSRMSVYLRFGTISTRDIFRVARSKRTDAYDKFYSELIWREYMAQRGGLPRSATTATWGPHDPAVSTEVRRERFAAWCSASTGYPIVDAAMCELLTTGYVHNRMRMLVACFLVKLLDVPWQWGERFFAQHLLDYELFNNIGGWHWVASIGADAQPPFQVFNPWLQAKKFDPQGRYIRQYLGTRVAEVTETQKLFDVLPCPSYCAPIVEYNTARAMWLSKVNSSSSNPTVGTCGKPWEAKQTTSKRSRDAPAKKK